MNLDRIEEIINLVKSNDVKNLNIKILKTKSNLILLKVLLHKLYLKHLVYNLVKIQTHNHHLHKLKANHHQMLKKSNLQW